MGRKSRRFIDERLGRIVLGAEKEIMSGKLYIVATPIGNLQDITLRAINTLKKVNFILSEDTRTTIKLCRQFEITTPLRSFHEHSSDAAIESIIQKIQDGNNAALVSEAGTPAISDPGGKLVDRALKAKIQIVPIPGVSALTALASVAGIAMSQFLFLGFLPKKGHQKMWQELSQTPYPIIIYESPRRLLKTLAKIRERLGNRFIIVGREMTKMFEEILRGKVEEVEEKLAKRSIKGEITLIISHEPGQKKEKEP
jgi:16S rRNA (cytidine1402-2'-O)-methyltransferase